LKIVDGFLKSQKSPIFVIPAKLVLDLIGERESREIIPPRDWTPAFAGVTVLETFYKTIIIAGAMRKFLISFRLFFSS